MARGRLTEKLTLSKDLKEVRRLSDGTAWGQAHQGAERRVWPLLEQGGQCLGLGVIAERSALSGGLVLAALWAVTGTLTRSDTGRR